jgi:hypothetical protein
MLEKIKLVRKRKTEFSTIERHLHTRTRGWPCHFSGDIIEVGGRRTERGSTEAEAKRKNMMSNQTENCEE